jgi:hypothetical protein
MTGLNLQAQVLGRDQQFHIKKYPR